MKSLIFTMKIQKKNFYIKSTNLNWINNERFRQTC